MLPQLKGTDAATEILNNSSAQSNKFDERVEPFGIVHMNLQPTTHAPSRLTRRQLVAAFLLLFLFTFILLRTAWTGDDAFITLRVVDNFVNGFGLTWNTDERVQVYTHPLWLFALTLPYAFTREPYFTTLALCLSISILTFVILLRITAGHFWLTLLIGVAAIGSKAFVDYSSSGLENPLTHLLIVLFALAYLRSRQNQQTVLPLGMCAAALMLNRLDLGLLVLPALAERLLRLNSWSARLRLALLAFAPVLAWLAFATFYYGFPFPNTYYAKQAAGIPRIEFIERGLAYTLSLLLHDPLTAVVILMGFILALSRRQTNTSALALGGLAYTVYVVWIGGDFMQGRMFTPAFVVALFCLAASLREHQLRLAPVGVAGLFAFSLLGHPTPTWAFVNPQTENLTRTSVWTGASKRTIGLYQTLQFSFPRLQSLRDIIDERQSFFHATSLWRHLIGATTLDSRPEVKEAKWLRKHNGRVSYTLGIGLHGFYGGAQLRTIDAFALADALIARLPTLDTHNWRVGHITRPMPDGYLLTRLYNRNYLSDQNLRWLYDELDLITRGPLWDTKRLESIIGINLRPPQISLSSLSPTPRDQDVNNLAAKWLEVPYPEGLTIVRRTNDRLDGILFYTDAATSYTLSLAGYEDEYNQLTFTLPAVESSRKAVIRFVAIPESANAQPGILRLKPQHLGPAPTAGYIRQLGQFAREVVAPQLLDYRITLSQTIGLEGPLWAKSQDQLKLITNIMGGVWWASASTRYTLSLDALPLCDEGNLKAEVYLNSRRIASHAFNQSAHWTPTLSLPPAHIKTGWNLLEIHLSKHSPTCTIGIRRLSLRTEVN
jgi:arabinofuranosyltransferase